MGLRSAIKVQKSNFVLEGQYCPIICGLLVFGVSFSYSFVLFLISKNFINVKNSFFLMFDADSQALNTSFKDKKQKEQFFNFVFLVRFFENSVLFFEFYSFR